MSGHDFLELAKKIRVNRGIDPLVARELMEEIKMTDFWAVAGSLHSRIKLTDEQLDRARKEFGKRWARPHTVDKQP